MEYVKINEADVPESVWDEMTCQIERFSTAIILNDQFLGSGTFISWDENFGILTAEHVTNNPTSSSLRFRFSGNSDQMMNLTVVSYGHNLKFDVRFLKSITLGPRLSEEYGPDMSVIVLPESPQLSAIRAKKSFWPLTIRTEQKLELALLNKGVTVIAGHPVEEQVVTKGQRPMTFSRSVPGLAGRTIQRDYVERDGFDYVEVSSDKGPGSQPPVSFGGVSGGGLWRVRLERNRQADNSKIRPVPYLLGVMFWQSSDDNGYRTLRAHGPKTIYQSLLSKLRAA